MKRALFIDDDEDYLYIVSRLFKRGSIPNLSKLTTALNGRLALDLLIENLDAELPEAIFVDINMPVMDGHEFLEKFAELREKHHQLRDIYPIAVVTSSTSEKDKQLIDQRQFVQRYLVKDIGMSELALQINELLS